MGEYMTMDDSNFIGMRRGVRERRRKNRRKMTGFAIFAFDFPMARPIAQCVLDDLAYILRGPLLGYLWADLNS